MSTEELPGGSSLHVGGVNYESDSAEITPKQHEENLRILREIDAGLGGVAVRDEVAEEIQAAFMEDSHRYGGKYTPAEECGIDYDGFIDPDGYNNPASYGDDRR